MPKAKNPDARLPHAAPLRPDQLPPAINLLKKRLDEAKGMEPRNAQDISIMATTLATKVSQSFVDIYGAGTFEADEAKVTVDIFYPFFGTDDLSFRLDCFRNGQRQVVTRLQATIDLFEEKLAMAGNSGKHVLRAYEQLDLHAEIERAAGKLYRDGHYANAIEDAVKALNALVRMRSGRDDLDGTTLMQTVFSPNNPTLKFNALADQSDQEEQKGFMMLFTGAVAGLRNPRAHKLIQDDPERALEFIAFISLLAKLLDEAKR